MKKHPLLESGFSRARFLSALLFSFLGLSLAMMALAAPRARDVKQRAGDWRHKVDARVLAAAATGEPVEFMIYMAQQADLSSAAALKTKAEKGAFVYQQLTAFAEATQAPVRAALTQLGAQFKPFWISNALWVKGDMQVVQALANLPAVGMIQPLGKGGVIPPRQEEPASPQLNAPPAPDATQALGQGIAKVNAAGAWALGYRGQGVVVAGADTGVRYTHNAVRNKYRGWGGSAATSTHDYNWHDAIHATNTICPGDSPEPCDDDEILGGGHGTHTMGTMVGDDGAGEQIGMAPDAKWVACRNLTLGVGVIPTYLECMEWFIAPTKIDGSAADTTKAPDVVNNSWGCIEGCPPEPNPLRTALQNSRMAGIVYVVSAGNDGPACATLQNPLGRYPESFTVGSTTHTTDTVSSFSSRGPTAVDPEDPTSPLFIKPNISAPGSTIRSSLKGSDTEYGNLSGTSMAGPHVAGLVALVISANPALAGNVDEIENIIEQTAVQKTTTEACGGDTNTQVPNNTYGWGRIDALAAVQRAVDQAGLVPLVGVFSRKTHGAPGNTFDLPLPLGDPAGVECRIGQPADGNHTIVVRFLHTIAGVGGAAVTNGTGSVSSSGVGTDPKEYIINLSGVANEQTVTLTLTGVTDSAGNSTPTISVEVDFLFGDTNADTRVNVGDTNQTKSASGQVTDNNNFRTDPNLDGRINVGDTNFVKAHSGDCVGVGCQDPE